MRGKESAMHPLHDAGELTDAVPVSPLLGALFLEIRLRFLEVGDQLVDLDRCRSESFLQLGAGLVFLLGQSAESLVIQLGALQVGAQLLGDFG
jgi:hypothetical protein